MMGTHANGPPDSLTPLIPEHFYTINDVATILRLKYTAARGWLARNIPKQYHLRVGGRKLIPLHALVRGMYKAWTCPHCGGDLRNEAVK